MAGSIVCGVDGSAPARAATRLGAALSDRLGHRLVLAHALPRAADDHDAALAMLAGVRRVVAAPAARLLVMVGPAAERLLEAADDVAIVAVGGGGGARRPPLRNGMRTLLAQRAPCPVAVVPAVPRLGGTGVLCGVRDWTDAATAGVAARLAGPLGLPLTLVHVLPRAVGHAQPSSALPEGVRDRPWDRDGAYRLLDGAAAAAGGAAELHVLHGAAGRVLAEEAAVREAALLVVGAPTPGRPASASAQLMRRSRRPLIVCPVPSPRVLQRSAGGAPAAGSGMPW